MKSIVQANSRGSFLTYSQMHLAILLGPRFLFCFLPDCFVKLFLSLLFDLVLRI